MHRMLVFTFLIITSVAGTSFIQPSLNPGCKECLSNENILVYTKVSQSDTDYVIHQIWDFTGHHPTILYIITDQNSTLQIEWDDKIPRSINTSTPPIYSFATILSNLFEYNDHNDTVFFDYTQPYHHISLKNITWVLQESVLTEYEASVVVHGSLYGSRNGTNGTVEIKFLLLPYDDRALALPRLFHSPRTTLADIGLVELNASSDYKEARFAVRYVIVSQDCATGHLNYSVHRTIDDEYTPGVFEMINLLTPSSERNSSGGYLQYRPVGYTARKRSVGTSVQASLHSYNKASIPSDSLAKRYYAHHIPGLLLVQEAVASFGDRGDGFYRQTNYTAWSVSVGYGAPATEEASMFVALALALGLGAPLLALSVAGLASARLLRRVRRA